MTGSSTLSQAAQAAALHRRVVLIDSPASRRQAPVGEVIVRARCPDAACSTGRPLARCLISPFPAAPGPNPPCQFPGNGLSSDYDASTVMAAAQLPGHPRGHPIPFRLSALRLPPG